jgi:hypothetical protein
MNKMELTFGNLDEFLVHFRLQQQIGKDAEQTLPHLRRNAIGGIFRDDLERLPVDLQSFF